MIVFIELVKRASILHEKFFIYSKQFTIQYKHTTNSPTKQLTKLNNTSEYFHTTKQTNKHISTNQTN